MGVLLSAKKKKRMNVFSELYEFNEQLILNLKFSRAPLDKVAGNFKLMPEMLRGSIPLEGKDGQFICDYLFNLGKTDALSQVDYLNGRREWLARYRDESRTEYRKYSSLYIKIFFMIGVLMAVLLA